MVGIEAWRLPFGMFADKGAKPAPRPEQLMLNGSIIPPEGEFFSLGGQIKEVDVRKDAKIAKTVNDLYLQQSAIEHFSDVTPTTTPKDLQQYYRSHPSAKLFIAELRGEVVGAVTVAPEEGLHSAKINRIVRKEDRPGLGVGEALGRYATDLCFAFPPEGFGVSSITIGVILDVKGSPSAIKLFQKLGFKVSEEIPNRCDGYSKEYDKLVQRKVAVMILTRERYESDQKIERLRREEEARQASLSPVEEKPTTTLQ